MVQPAVLDVTCELPLQVVPPAYLPLPTWDTHCEHVWGVVGAARRAEVWGAGSGG